MINKFLIYIIFFVNLSFFANASTEIPFPNMFVSKVPITYKEEIEFKGFEGKAINLSNNHNEYISLRKSVFTDSIESSLFNKKKFAENFFRLLKEIV